MRGKKDATTFPSHNIYSALLQRIEHCSTRKSTCRLPIKPLKSEAIHETGLSGNVVASFFPLIIFIYIYIKN